MAHLQDLLALVKERISSTSAQLQQAVAAAESKQVQFKQASAVLTSMMHIEVNPSASEVLWELVRSVDTASIMLAMEEHNVSIDGWAAFVSLFNKACAQVAGTPLNDPKCPKLMVPAGVVQGSRNKLQADFQSLKPARGRRNAGCVNGLYEVIKLIVRNTQSKSDTVYIKLHVDGNAHNGKKHLFLTVINATDNIPGSVADEQLQGTDDDSVPLLSRVQDPNSNCTFDLGCLTTDSGLPDKDIESVEVRVASCCSCCSICPDPHVCFLQVVRANLGVLDPQIKLFMEGLRTRARLRRIAAAMAHIRVPRQLRDQFASSVRLPHHLNGRLGM